MSTQQSLPASRRCNAITARVLRSLLLYLPGAMLFLAGAGRGWGQTPDEFSQAALNTINSDIGQEIIAGSSNLGSVSAPFYFPVTNANMLPALVGSTGTAGMENLLKVSIPSPFYSGAGYSATGAVRASAALTTATSQNGVSLTPALWNAALYLPVSGTDNTPALASGTFPTPNWVLVANDGSNPSAWSSGLITGSGNTNPVVGRYAYAIYHEGGLLDANVAGYPSTSTTAQTASKTSLAYADLTQLGLTAAQVDEVVGWRNYATTQAPGSPTAPGFTLASASNYYAYVVSNSNGYLTPNPAVYNGQTDQMFTSRQELINFMEGQLGLSGTSLDILNYLATFTRGLNAPSIVPDPTRPLIQHNGNNGGNDAYGLDSQINPVFPTVLVTGTGFMRNDGSIATPGQPLVNKRFPLNRLAWLTYLGPSAYRNIPTSNPGVGTQDYDMWQLVNTYGFSPAYLQQGTAANIANYFGLTWALDTEPSGKSTVTGFHDNTYKWFYNVHCETAGHQVSATAGNISRIEDIASAAGGTAREPDFFELLKAAVLAGSKAKGAINLTGTGATAAGINSVTLSPYYVQCQRDTTLNYAILQLGANIIDQAKCDGYATRIVYNDNSGLEHEFRGVENLPYLYRIQTGTLKLRMESPNTAAVEPGINGPNNENQEVIVSSTSTQLADTGVVMVMHLPVIWNPHDAGAAPGSPGPTQFRLIADSTDPDHVDNAGNTTGYNGFGATGYDPDGSYTTPANENAYLPNSSGIPSGIKVPLFSTGTNGTGAAISSGENPVVPKPLNAANTAMTFQVPATSEGASLFREPTLLAMPNVPAGSDLALAWSSTLSSLTLMTNSAGKAVLQNGGFTSESPNPLNLPNAPASNQPYIGIYLGLYPDLWIGPRWAYTSVSTLSIRESVFASLETGTLTNPYNYLTYRLQYIDPATGNWVTYDEKYTQVNDNWLSTALGSAMPGSLVQSTSVSQTGNIAWQSYIDPRTARFGAIVGPNYLNPPVGPGAASSQEWVDPANNVIMTDRPDANSGFAVTANRPSYSAFSSYVASGWSLDPHNPSFFRRGLFSQNSPLALDNGTRYAGDSPAYVSTNNSPMCYSDADGVTRGAMGAYVAPGVGSPASTTVGLPMATSYPAGYAFASGTYQGQSRPYFLHRPYRSVAELGYVFSGTPWKNIDLFTPQSGDAALLDLFTINEPPSGTVDPNEMVAGVVNLNTRQTPVLQAVLGGASVDEAQTSGLLSTGFTPLSGAQANALLTGTTGTNLLTHTAGTAAGYGPLENVSELVGRWNSSLLSGTNYAGAYTGVSADLGGLYGSVFGAGTAGLTMQNVDRFRESFIRPLAAVGNTRVWNVMIDLVAQTGEYQPGATTLDNFTVSTQHRYWLHEAIDRYTGQILDQSLEPVGPASLALTGTSVGEHLAAGTTVGSLSSSELLTGGTFTYSLVSGTGDNASFSITGNTLQTAAVFDYLTKSNYNVVLRVTDQSGFTYDQPVTVSVQPAPYTAWKVANFGASASDPTVAGDTVDAANDGLPNLLKYALGDSPLTPCVSGIAVVNNGTTLTMNYALSSAATDVTVTASCTSDVSNPSSWTTNGVTQTMLSDNGTIQQWQASVPMNGAPTLFMRLKVTHQ